MLPVQIVALWIHVTNKPNKKFDMPMTGSQEVLRIKTKSHKFGHHRIRGF